MKKRSEQSSQKRPVVKYATTNETRSIARPTERTRPITWMKGGKKNTAAAEQTSDRKRQCQSSRTRVTQRRHLMWTCDIKLYSYSRPIGYNCTQGFLEDFFSEYNALPLSFSPNAYVCCMKIMLLLIKINIAQIPLVASHHDTSRHAI